MYLRVKSELFWAHKDNYIELYFGNNQLNRTITTENNYAFFDFIKFLKNGKNKEEIKNYKKLTEMVNIDDIDFIINCADDKKITEDLTSLLNLLNIAVKKDTPFYTLKYYRAFEQNKLSILLIYKKIINNSKENN